LKESQPQKPDVIRTNLEFLEAYLTSDGKFKIAAHNMKTLKI